MRLKQTLLVAEAIGSFIPLLVFFMLGLFSAPSMVESAIWGPRRMDSVLMLLWIVASTAGLYGFWWLFDFALFEAPTNKQELVKASVLAMVGIASATGFGVLMGFAFFEPGLPWFVALPIVVTVHFGFLAYWRYREFEQSANK